MDRTDGHGTCKRFSRSEANDAQLSGPGVVVGGHGQDALAKAFGHR